MVGDVNATISGADFPNGGIIIAKDTGKSVSLGSNLSGVSGLVVESGTLNLLGYTMTVNGPAAVASDAGLAFTVSSATTQLTVNGNLAFGNGSSITVTDNGLPSPTAPYGLIAATNLTDNGVTINSTGLDSNITTGPNGKVKISKS